MSCSIARTSVRAKKTSKTPLLFNQQIYFLNEKIKQGKLDKLFIHLTQCKSMTLTYLLQKIYQIKKKLMTLFCPILSQNCFTVLMPKNEETFKMNCSKVSPMTLLLNKTNKFRQDRSKQLKSWVKEVIFFRFLSR